MLGRLLSIPIRVLNIPFRAVEKGIAAMCGEEDLRTESRIISKPLDILADAIKEIDND